MSVPDVISDQQVTGRKCHTCFYCGRDIPKGVKHRRCTMKYDDIYTLRTHNDCEDAVEFLLSFHGLSFWDFDSGIPPLAEIMDGEFTRDCNTLRGHFPAVVARLELGRQLAEIRAMPRGRKK